MNQPIDFNTKFLYLDNVIKLNTLSPDREYFYRHQGPQTLGSNGPYCSPIAFYDIKGNLIYYNRKREVQFLITNNTDLQLVVWSSPDKVLFLERDSTSSAYFIVLDLKNKTSCCRSMLAFNMDTWSNQLFEYLPKEIVFHLWQEILKNSPDQGKYLYNWARSLDTTLSLKPKASYLDKDGSLISITPYNASNVQSFVIAALNEYYGAPDKMILIMLRSDGIGDRTNITQFINNTIFDDFKPVIPDKPSSNFLILFDNIKWRP